jgi:hypothetical protein
MKKSLVITGVLLSAFVFVGQIFAQASQPKEWSNTEFQNELAKAKPEKFTGTVVSHDPVCHCVVVKTPKGELTLQDDYAKFMQKYDRAKGLIIGSKVNGSYKMVNHIYYLMDIAYVKAATTALIPAYSRRSI